MTGMKNENSVISQNEMLERYKRAAEIEHLLVDDYTDLNARVVPNWMKCGTKFWYKRKDERETQYWLVDAAAAKKRPAFDHERLAQELSSLTGEDCDPADLPVSIESITDTEILFSAFDRNWKYEVSGGLSGEEADRKPAHPAHWRMSPNGRTALFTRDFNLWARDVDSSEERPLTTDGVKHYSYASEPEARDLVAGFHNMFPEDKQPEALWSPDGKKVFTYQLDERAVETLPSMLYVPYGDDIRPRVVERKFPLAGDEYVPTFRFVVLDVETGAQIAVDHTPIEDSYIWLCPVSGNRCWWSADSSKAYFLDMARGHKSVSVVEVHAESGACRTLFEETSDTFLGIDRHPELPSSMVPLPDTGELLWFSYRSGYRHLYLYDLDTGALKNTITEGDWSVHDVVALDEGTREVFVTNFGRQEENFYFRDFVRVNIDSGEMTSIASGDFDVQVTQKAISPDKKHIVVTYSRVDTPQRTELRDRFGEVVMIMEEADLSRLPEGWEWPEPFEVLADDGVTKLYGTIYKPSNFDPKKKYPILDFGQWASGVAYPKHSFLPVIDEIAMSIAELGVVVVTMGGRGGGFREKSIRDYGYDDFWEIGATRDHVAGINQLADTRPFMDLDRVGVWDPDNNGALFGLLDFPEFYKAGIVSSLYDPRLCKHGEVFSGITDEEKRREFQIWGDKIHNLKGKLLIITGMLDIWWTPSMTFRLTDALLRANKDFDHYVHPHGGHIGRCIYARRRIWDFITRHLIGGEPPEDFIYSSALDVRLSNLIWEPSLVEPIECEVTL